MKNASAVTRFAPSPTGLLQAGNYRTALFSYLYARQNGGKFYLRIEDTDKERSKKEYEENIFDSLNWLGIKYDALPDGKPYVLQSDRVESHKKHLQNLIEKGFAYVSKEEREGKVTEPVRFKNPGTKVTFTDMIRGEITVDTTDLKDFVIARNVNEPLFHLAVVIDDFEMGVTHVIRGDDHISNTPRQILIQRALGMPTPLYAHLPLVLAPDRTKLSKRKGALAMTEYRARGYLPEAMLNFMALLGWNPGTEQEILSLEDLVKLFNIEKIQKGGAIFNEEKLRWLNKEYLKKLPAEKITAALSAAMPASAARNDHTEVMLQKITPLVLERIETLGDIAQLWHDGELTAFFEFPKYESQQLIGKGSDDAATVRHLEWLATALEKIDEQNWNAENIKAAIFDYATKEGRGAVLWPLRFCLSGREKSPDPFTLADILGKHETLARVRGALQALSGRAA